MNNNIQTNFNDVTDNDYESAHTDFRTIQDMYEYINKMATLEKDLEVYKSKLNDVEQKLKDTPDVNELKKPDEVSCFKTETEMYQFKAQVEAMKMEIKSLEQSEDPYTKSIEDVKKAIEEIKFADNSSLKELENKQAHNEILLKLLNSPSSYIRQAILDKSLEFLNQRIKHYLVKLGYSLTC